MKQFLFLLFASGFFFIMLIFPKETLQGASNGLLLWFQIIMPTLLPFIISSNLLINTNCVYYISKILKPFVQRIFHISDYSCYAVLVGFLCGYPMGAKVIADLIKGGYISRTEGQYLLSFCNNTSPMFIISFIILQSFGDSKYMLPSLCILYAAPILCSFLFRYYYCIGSATQKSILPSVPKIVFDFTILDNCIMNGFETITKVGGYIMLFSILFTLGNKTSAGFLLPLLEITNGITFLTNTNLSFSWLYVFTLTFTAFGGLCAVAQSYSVIQGSGLKIFPYITQKLITATVTSLLALCYIKFILQ